MKLEGKKVQCFSLSGNLVWGREKTVCLGLPDPKQPSSRSGCEQVWGIFAGLLCRQHCGCVEWDSWCWGLDVCPMEVWLSLWRRKCCCRSPLHVFWVQVGVFVFNFRLMLVWSCRPNAPCLLKGIRCIPGSEPELDFISKKSHQCALRLFCAVNQSTEVLWAEGRGDSLQSVLISWTQTQVWANQGWKEKTPERPEG